MSDAAVTPPRQPAQVTPPQTPELSSLLTLASVVVVVAALSLAREVLIPITLAILLSFVLAPIVAVLRRAHIPHVPSVIVAVIIGIAGLGALGGLIGVQVAGLAGDVPQYASTLETKIGNLRGATIGRLRAVTAELGTQIAADSKAPAAATPGEAATAAGPKPMPVVVQAPAADPLTVARTVLEPLLAPLESGIIIFIVAVFILMQKEDLRDRLIRLFGSGDLHKTTTAMDDAASRLSKYFLAQLAINATFGAVIGVGLYFIGVPSPILWGVLSAILRFVPYVGPVIAAALPAALAAAVSPNWTMVAWVIGLFAAVESVTGQVVEPLIYGHSTGLSPVAVVVAAIFWAWLWGPIGLILSTPLTLCLVVLGRYVDRLEFLEVLLGDRPALTPVENFYQRMLADDPDEALQQAELLLKERSLTTYYDEVALKGLQLAANDAERGVLSEEKMQRITRSVRSLVTDLADHDDRDPHPAEKEEAEAVASKAEHEDLATDGAKRDGPRGGRPRPGMANGEAGVMPRRQGAARRSGLLDPGAASRQARSGSPHGVLRGRLAGQSRQARPHGRRHGVHQLPRTDRQSRGAALPDASAAPAAAEGHDPRRAMAGRGQGGRGHPRDQRHRGRPLHVLAPRCARNLCGRGAPEGGADGGRRVTARRSVHADVAGIVALAQLDAVVAEQAIGRRAVKVEVGENEAEQVVVAAKRKRARATFHGNIPVLRSVDGGGRHGTAEFECAGDPRPQGGEARLVVGVAGHLDARETGGRALGEIGHDLHLPRQREHIGVEPRLEESGLVDLAGRRMLLGLGERCGKRVEPLHESGDGDLRQAQRHG